MIFKLLYKSNCSVLVYGIFNQWFTISVVVVVLVVLVLLLLPLNYIVLSSKEYESQDSLNYVYIFFVSTSFRSIIYMISLLTMLLMLFSVLLAE